jgi:hypothetical protein
MQPPEPVFILAPPCTYSWVVAAMLGQHPDTYALPELHLFRTETVGEWLRLSRSESFEMDHGLVRAVAQLCFGGQSEVTALEARGWLQRRAHMTTGLLLEQIAERVAPRILVERSPSHVYGTASMRRMHEMFPNARFVHLTGHPCAYGETVMGALARRDARADVDPRDWLAQLAWFPHEDDGGQKAEEPDPQWAWLALHRNIDAFLECVAQDHKKRIKAEDVLAGDHDCLTTFAQWLGIRADPIAIDAMRHPERSAYAAPGPPTASSGSDAFMFGGCDFPAEWLEARTLEGSVRWLAGDIPLQPAVSGFAAELGYQ